MNLVKESLNEYLNNIPSSTLELDRPSSVEEPFIPNSIIQEYGHIIKTTTSDDLYKLNDYINIMNKNDIMFLNKYNNEGLLIKLKKLSELNNTYFYFTTMHWTEIYDIEGFKYFSSVYGPKQENDSKLYLITNIKFPKILKHEIS